MSSKTLKNSVLVLENYLEGYRYPPAFLTLLTRQIQ